MHIQFKDQGIAMLYESLILAIYEREDQDGHWKGMDPLGFGDADTYGRFVEAAPDSFVEGKVRFAAAMGALAFQFPAEEISSQIREIILDIASAQTQDDIIVQINKSVELVEQLERQ